MTILLGQVNQESYPLVPIREVALFPSTENVLIFGRKKSILAFEEAYNKDKKIVLVSQKDPNIDEPKKEDFYKVGLIGVIEKRVVGEKGEINALIRGEDKVLIKEFIKEEPYFEVRVEKIKEDKQEDEEVLAMVKYISNQIKKAINLGKTVDFTFLVNILNITSPDPTVFSYQVAMVLDLRNQERQKLLEENNLKNRLKKEIDYINREIKILEIEYNITSKTQQRFEKGMKETGIDEGLSRIWDKDRVVILIDHAAPAMDKNVATLREKMKTIEEELGQKSELKEIDEYKLKIKKAKMPKNVEEKALKELKRLEQMSQFNPETSYIRTYLDWLVELPWSVLSPNNIDIKRAEKILNDEHYGLKKVKERILEYLAVLELRRKKGIKETRNPTILCFVGPPGVGKTSLGKSIAHALGRKFVKISLGGIRDEAEIRGHRRTYVGALPGRIIQGIKQASTRNPVFMLDEIDKVGRDYRGDPSAALLEALDPEQNHSFSDHYLEVDFNLSDVFFITTANILDTIPDALRDRLEIIHFPGYTEDEKFHIAKDYLVKKQLESNSLDTKEVVLKDDSLRLIIRRYTREAGVRELERQIGTIMRKVAREIVEKKYKNRVITPKLIPKYLGPFKYSSQMIEEKDTIGIATGLAWTQAGGDILFIEVSIMPGKGHLTLTGHLGDVMKESCQAALSYIRSRWDKFKLEKNFFQKVDIHVHVPEGAVPKDGPSAGLAIATAMVSALTKTPTDRTVAMTGEITLRGRALEIGGVKEKVIAAHRAGIKTVIMPKDNKKDLVDIPKYVLDDLKFVFVENVDEVLKTVFKGKKFN